ncbi:MAG: NlpC/P60 family protein [Acidimicrobiia bacterium]
MHRSGTTPRHRWTGTALCVAILCSSLAGFGAGPVAAADPLAEKRAEAERLARELEEQGRRVSVLAERLNRARIEAAAVEERVAAAEAEVAAADAEVAAVRGRLRDRAVASYVRGGQLPVAQLLMRASANDVVVGRAYVAAVAGRERATVAALDRAQEARRHQRAELEAARTSARAVLARVDAERRGAEEAAGARRASLAAVEGELAALVEEETRRRAEEEARRVQAELAERQAREQAARAEAARRAAAAEAARRAAAEEAARTTTTARLPVPRLAATTTTTTTAERNGEAAPVSAARPPAPGAAAAVVEAKAQLGKPYEWGADGPDSFDCSGLTQWAWKAGGRTLPHSSVAQYSATFRVPVSEVQPGDLLFYGSPIHHVGIYAGDGQMVEASETGTPVRMRSIYRSDLVGVGRVG